MKKIDILLKAKKNKYAIGAFNVSSVEAIEAVFKAAFIQKSAIIVETSRGESEYLTPELTKIICEKFSQDFKVDYILHLDRAQNLNWIKRCLDAGYDSVTAESLDPNKKMTIEDTIEIKNVAQKYNVIVEGSLEVVPLRYYKNIKKGRLTISDPQDLKIFAEATQIDSLVVSIGTQSGCYKKVNKIHWDVLEKTNKLLPNLPLVLHGGSFLSCEMIKKAVNNGITKININSELRYGYTTILKRNIKNNPQEYCPYKLLFGVKEELQQIVEDKINIFKNLENEK